MKTDLQILVLERAATAGQAVHEGWRVRKDGWRLWAEGVPHEGAVFYFSLPQTPP